MITNHAIDNYSWSIVSKKEIILIYKTQSVRHAQTSRSHFNNTSGHSDPVWIHKVPCSAYPHAVFAPLKQSIKNTDVCIIGAGIAGISLAYELIARGGKQVTMIEARHVLSGETGRTSGHLSNALDDGYTNIEKFVKILSTISKIMWPFCRQLSLPTYFTPPSPHYPLNSTSANIDLNKTNKNEAHGSLESETKTLKRCAAYKAGLSFRR